MNPMKATLKIGMILFLLAILSCPAWAAPAKPSPELMKRVNEHYHNIEAFQANYKQVAESPTMGGPQSIVFKDVSYGVMSFLKPDMVRLDQNKPREEILVSDGKTSWWYIPEEKKAYKYTPQSQSGALKALVDIFSGKGTLSDSFNALLLDDQEGIKLRLIPALAGSDFEYLDVTLDAETLKLKALDLAYLMGQKTSFTFDHVDEGVNLKAGYFSFTPPKGAEVVNQNQ